MSYDVILADHTAPPCCSYGTPPDQYMPEFPGDAPCPEPCYPVVNVTRHAEGGTYVVGGTDLADLNITYNYAEYIWQALGDGGVKMLDGRRAGDVAPLLAAAVEALGTERDRDYWKPTRGNAGYALNILYEWAQQYPDAIFHVY